MRFAGMAILTLALVMALSPLGSSQPTLPVVRKCLQDLSRRLALPVESIRVSRTRQVVFPDASLGLPRPGETPARARTSGRALVLEAGHAEYLYTTSESRFRYGGPLRSWDFSALAIHRVPGDPNQNGNLVQTSLAGTNPAIRMRGVFDFQPQPDGSILASRRLSRSSQELLYLPAGVDGKEKRLFTAFELLAPTLNSSRTRWASFVRPRAGASWALARNPLEAAPEQARLLDLPGSSLPVRVLWEGADPVIEVQLAGATRFFTWKTEEGASSWRERPPHPDPLVRELQLNKSQRLEIRSSPQGSSTLVLEVWFTGDERVLASIPSFEVSQVSVSAAREFLVLSGRRGNEPRAFAVDLATGEVLPLPRKAQGETRILNAPVVDGSPVEKWLRPEL